jgi:hypothetical protein
MDGVSGKNGKVLPMLKYHAVKAYGEWRLAPRIRNVTKGGERSPSFLGRFAHGERAVSVHWVGSGVNPGGGLDVLKNGNILPLWRFEPVFLDPPAHSVVYRPSHRRQVKYNFNIF